MNKEPTSTNKQNAAPVPLFRTINGSVKYLREKDPDSKITTYMIRDAVRSGELRSRKVGTKNILDVNEVIAYFGGVLRSEDSDDDRKMGEFW